MIIFIRMSHSDARKTDKYFLEKNFTDLKPLFLCFVWLMHTYLSNNNIKLNIKDSPLF